MKKSIVSVLSVLTFAAMITACSSKQNDWINPVSNQSENDRIEIEFWHSMGSSNGELLQKLTDEFNQSQDEIYVKAIHQGSYADANTKFMAALSAGDAPVVAQMEIGNIGIFAEADQLVDLKVYAEDETFERNDFIWGLLDASFYEGELIALPHSRSLPVMYYNKDWFQFNGLNSEMPPRNWSELKRAAKTLTKNDVYGYSCPLDPWYFNALMMCAGGSIYNDTISSIGFCDEAGTAPLYLWKELIEDGIMYVPSGQDYNSSEACRNLFAEGTAAIIMQSSAQLKGLEQTCDFEVGVAPIPIRSVRVYPAGGSNLVMFQGHSEEKQKAGWEFIKFMTSTECSVTWANGTGYLPVRQSCMESDTYKEMLEEDENLQIIIDNVNYCSVIPFFSEYDETMEIISDEIQECILKDKYTPEDTVKQIAVRVEELLSIYRTCN
ncbi:MAG: ABC transporter substrate-binding protein [Lachnospiraceae bacterium]|nr:ABC transporter substrate-binding protein [Lachnospiraceae bacterium]